MQKFLDLGFDEHDVTDAIQPLLNMGFGEADVVQGMQQFNKDFQNTLEYLC